MLETFRASFTNELAKPSKFDVKIVLPKQLGSSLSTEILSYRCEMASLPGRTMETSDLKIYGPSEKMPHRSAYDDVTMTFIVTDAMEEKKVFDSWLNLINPVDNWNIEYKTNYVSDIIITQYDLMGNPSYSIKLIEAYPLVVNQLDLDWSNEFVYHKLSVVFTYRYWVSIDTNSVDGQGSATTPTTGGPASVPVASNSVQDTINDQAASYNNQFIGGMTLTNKGIVATTFNTEIGGMNLTQ